MSSKTGYRTTQLSFQQFAKCLEALLINRAHTPYVCGEMTVFDEPGQGRLFAEATFAVELGVADGECIYQCRRDYHIGKSKSGK